MHRGQGMALSQAQEHRRFRGGRTGTEGLERGEAQRLHLGKECQAAVQRGELIPPSAGNVSRLQCNPYEKHFVTTYSYLKTPFYLYTFPNTSKCRQMILCSADQEVSITIIFRSTSIPVFL